MRRVLLLPLLVLGLLAAAGPARAIDIFNLKNSLIQFALEQISTEDFTITAEAVESPGDGVTELVGVEVADGEGVWFTAERLGLQWNARRILRAELEINRLSAEGVRIMRAPRGEVAVREGAEIAETDDDPFDWPRAPIATRIEEVALSRVFVAGGVIAEQSIAFDATGSARDEGDEQAVALTLERTDAVAGRIALDYLRDFAANTLRLDLDAEEAPGGLVAALAGLPERSASEMTIAADGPLTDWALDFRAEAERVVVAEGAARIDAEGRIAATAGFTVTPGPGMGPDARAVLAPEARFRLDIAEGEDGVVRVREGRLASPALTLEADGTYDRPTGEMDLAVFLDGRAGLADLAEGVAFDGFGFDGRVRGTPEALDARGEITLDGLETAPADVGAARLSGEVRREGERVEVALDGRAEGLRLDRLGPDLLGAADLTLRGAYLPERMALETFLLDSALLTAEATGEVRLAAETAALDYRVDAPRLAPVAGAYGVTAAGAARVAGRLSGPLAAPSLDGEAAFEGLALDGTGYGDVRLTHALVLDDTPGGRVDLSATGSPYGPLDAATEFALAGERLTLAGLSARALGVDIAGERVTYALDTGLAEGELAIDAPDLGPLAALAGAPVAGSVEGTLGFRPAGGRQDVALDLAGRGIAAAGARVARLALEGRLRDALGTPALAATLEADDAAYEDATVARIEGRIEADDLTGTPDATFDLAASDARGFDAGAERVTLTGSLEDAIALARAEARIEGTGLSVADATVARLTADLSGTDLAAPLPGAELDARAEGIAAAGARLASADLAARLTGEAADGRLTATLDTAPVEADGARIAGLAARARIDAALGPDPLIDARAETGAVTAGDLALDGLTAAIAGRLAALDARAATEGTLGRDPVRLAAEARIDAAGRAQTLRLTRLDGALGAAEIGLGRPLTVTVEGSTTRAEGIDLNLPGGRLAGEAALFANGLAADVLLDLDDLAPLAGLADLPVTEGALRLDAALDTRPGRAEGAVTLAAPGLRFADVIGPGALDLAAEADWDGREAALDARLSGPFGDPVAVTAALPLRPSGGALPRVPAGAELAGRAGWSGEIGDLWALVPAPGHVLDGRLDLDLALSGPVADPALAGTVALSDGMYQNLDLGTILTDLSVGSEVAADGDLVLDLSARDGDGGQVSAEIEIDGPALDAALTTREAVLVRRDDATAAISMDIRAAGPLAGPDISGSVTVDRAEIRLVNATPPGVVTLGDVRVKGTPPPEKEAPAGAGIALDVTVRGERDIFVRGRGLDSEWRIALDVTGTAAKPRVVGAIERVRGRLDFIGTPFDLSRGRIRFTGDTPVDPALDVQLAAENEGLTGFIEVTGRASDPQIGFASRPALPEDEVLPRVLFGTSRQSLTPSQAIRLGAGLATLLDGTGGPVDAVRGAVGLDQLAIDPTAEGGADVTLGKNLGDDVFVGAKQPIGGEGEPRVTVELEVFDGVTLDGEVEPGGGSSVGVNWSTDF